MSEDEVFDLKEWVENKFIVELESEYPSNVPDDQKYIVDELFEMKRILNILHQFLMDVQDICLEEEKYQEFLKLELANRYMKIKTKIKEVLDEL